MSTNTFPVAVNEKNTTVTILQGVTTAITGISITDTTNSGDIFLVSAFDQYGLLSTSSAPGISNFLSFFGSLDQVNLALANLTDTSSVPGMDMLTIVHKRCPIWA